MAAGVFVQEMAGRTPWPRRLQTPPPPSPRPRVGQPSPLRSTQGGRSLLCPSFLATPRPPPAAWAGSSAVRARRDTHGVVRPAPGSRRRGEGPWSALGARPRLTPRGSRGGGGRAPRGALCDLAGLRVWLPLSPRPGCDCSAAGCWSGRSVRGAPQPGDGQERAQDPVRLQRGLPISSGFQSNIRAFTSEVVLAKTPQTEDTYVPHSTCSRESVFQRETPGPGVEMLRPKGRDGGVSPHIPKIKVTPSKVMVQQYPLLAYILVRVKLPVKEG
ncbi:uncharacterized protein LOC134473446 [Cavia porcellus]|uniref:uncharacterized protein LOC134473446 n=1 Tax=Cavia porcellus TaxID=10141 RepID=UPI002FE1B826